jgi:hypothetical protein
VRHNPIRTDSRSGFLLLGLPSVLFLRLSRFLPFFLFCSVAILASDSAVAGLSEKPPFFRRLAYRMAIDSSGEFADLAPGKYVDLAAACVLLGGAFDTRVAPTCGCVTISHSTAVRVHESIDLPDNAERFVTRKGVSDLSSKIDHTVVCLCAFYLSIPPQDHAHLNYIFSHARAGSSSYSRSVFDPQGSKSFFLLGTKHRPENNTFMHISSSAIAVDQTIHQPNHS